MARKMKLVSKLCEVDGWVWGGVRKQGVGRTEYGHLVPQIPRQVSGVGLSGDRCRLNNISL